jgi:uncharacterized protein YukE
VTSAAQLSSIQTSLSELAASVTSMADGFTGTAREDLAVALYEVERNLNTASRRLERIVDSLR